MTCIQCDSREHASEWERIKKQFDKLGVRYFRSKLYVGDYMSLDNPRVIVDRKQNLTELTSNVCQNHDRFRRELVRAQENGIQLVILCEHGNGIETLEDVIFWRNPRGYVRKKIDGHWQEIKTKAMTGETLYRILTTIRDKYGVQFEFCEKSETGRRIMELLE